MNENKRFDLMTYQKLLRPKIGIWLGLLALILLATACSGMSEPAATPASTDDGAVRIPVEAQSYVDMVTQLLVDDLAISPDQVELESITEPATSAEPYIIKVVVGDIMYEYHGLDGEIQLISISEPEPSVIND